MSSSVLYGPETPVCLTLTTPITLFSASAVWMPCPRPGIPFPSYPPSFLTPAPIFAWSNPLYPCDSAWMSPPRERVHRPAQLHPPKQNQCPSSDFHVPIPISLAFLSPAFTKIVYAIVIPNSPSMHRVRGLCLFLFF